MTERYYKFECEGGARWTCTTRGQAYDLGRCQYSGCACRGKVHRCGSTTDRNEAIAWNRPPQKTEPIERVGLTNADRADWAGAAIAAYSAVVNTDELVSDLLADLRHWCDREGIDFDEADERAFGNYAAEKYEEGEL